MLQAGLNGHVQQGTTEAQMHHSNTRKVTVLSVAIVTASLGALATWLYIGTCNNQQLNNIFTQALLSGTNEGLAAINQLSSDPNDLATVSLLMIASTDIYPPDVREGSIAALANRTGGTIDVSSVIARFFDPDSSLGMRERSARALAEMECSRRCIGHLMTYLFRLSQGDLNIEDRAVRDRLLPKASENVSKTLKDDQRQLVDDVISILKRYDNHARELLIKRYGLGTGSVAVFAVQMAATLELDSACPLLSQSSRETSSKEVQQAIASARKQLQCQP